MNWGIPVPLFFLSLARSPEKNFELAANILFFSRTLVFVEGDVSMRHWEDPEGKRQSALNIVQRMSLRHRLFHLPPPIFPFRSQSNC
jgi:hypothetical protein